MEMPALNDGVIGLRSWRDSDAGDIVEMCQDAEIVRWTPVPSPYGEAEARAFLADQQRCAEEGRSLAYAISDSAGEVVLGSISVRIVAPGVGEVGYFVRASERRRGIARAALNLLGGWAFEALGLVRLQITIRPENLPSRRLAETCGYHFEGVLRSWLEIKGEHGDAAVYSLLPGELV